MSALHDTEWQLRSACAGLDRDLWFDQDDASVAYAKSVCQPCVVRLSCLSWALDMGEKYGSWGGLSQNELRRVRRKRQEMERRKEAG